MSEIPLHLYPREKFPIVVEFHRASVEHDLAPLHSFTMEAPPDSQTLYAVEVPPLAKTLGFPIRVVIRFGDSTVSRTGPPS